MPVICEGPSKMETFGDRGRSLASLPRRFNSARCSSDFVSNVLWMRSATMSMAILFSMPRGTIISILNSQHRSIQVNDRSVWFECMRSDRSER